MSNDEGGKMPELDGGPAFPLAIPTHRFVVCADGMSLRDYFAAAALTFLRRADDDGAYPGLLPTITARNAYTIADAMLKERAKS